MTLLTAVNYFTQPKSKTHSDKLLVNAAECCHSMVFDRLALTSLDVITFYLEVS